MHSSTTARRIPDVQAVGTGARMLETSIPAGHRRLIGLIKTGRHLDRPQTQRVFGNNSCRDLRNRLHSHLQQRPSAMGHSTASV